jgi:hypothetical protein
LQSQSSSSDTPSVVTGNPNGVTPVPGEAAALAGTIADLTPSAPSAEDILGESGEQLVNGVVANIDKTVREIRLALLSEVKADIARLGELPFSLRSRFDAIIEKHRNRS